MHYPATLETYETLKPGDRIELVHEVKVGFTTWETKTVGTILECHRQRHGLHRRRNFDDKVFRDQILLRKEDGELTTVTLDEFSQLRKMS